MQRMNQARMAAAYILRTTPQAVEASSGVNATIPVILHNEAGGSTVETASNLVPATMPAPRRTKAHGGWLERPQGRRKQKLPLSQVRSVDLSQSHGIAMLPLPLLNQGATHSYFMQNHAAPTSFYRPEV